MLNAGLAAMVHSSRRSRSTVLAPPAMLTPDKNRLLCEQCGQPMESGATVTGCLNCLLLGGLESSRSATTLPPTAAPRPGRAPGPAMRTYQHYEILTRPDGSPWELGRGAMGVTYKAMDVNLRVPVALKVIGTRFSAHPEARSRFLREARATAKLHHPNVASVHHFGTITLSLGDGPDAGEGDQTEYFYAMEFIEGETLEARVRRAGVLPPAAALEIALQIAHALAAAERRGMVHRDVKPANIMFTAEGEAALETGMSGDDGEAWVKIIDFGLAKAIKGALAAVENGDEAEPAGGPLTQGGFLGTPQFASPEQFAGGDVDARSDIFSLGVTLWYMLCGELPYDGSSVAEVRDRQLNRPLPVGQLEDNRVPKVVLRLLRSMLAPEPIRRPPSAHALCERLRRCLTTVREGGLLGQLKTRRVYRVVLGYAVGAWVILQICASGLRGLGAPVWAPHLLLVLLVAGLGAAALGGWAVDRRAIGKTLMPRQTARRLAFVAAAMLPSLLVAEYFHLTRNQARQNASPPPAPTASAASKTR